MNTNLNMQRIPIDRLKPAKYNPRKDLKPGDPAYEKIKRSLHDFGYVDPIVWNAVTGNIVGGHQRYKVLKAEGVTEVDCIVVHIENPANEKALNIALNKATGDWEPVALAELLQDLQASGYDLGATGFDAAEVDDLFSKVHDKRMVYQPTGSIYQVLSSEVATKHGLNVSACIFDELHTQPTRALYDVMTQGSGDARKQPLWFLLTTAGTDRNSICWEVHQKALDIIEGRKDDPRFYPVLFGLPDDADWTDERNWYRANPSLDKTITIDKVRDAFRKAKETPADENMFRQLRLNQWVKQSVRWMPMDRWDECGGVVDEYALEGRPCYAGLDLSSTSDLTAMVLVFPPRDEDEQYIVLPFFWLPEDTLQLRVRRDHVMYDKWERQGYIMTTEGNVVHYGFIEQFILKLGERFNIQEIAYDRWNATMMVQALEDDGFNMVPFGQGFRDMSPPTKELMRLVLERKLNHGGHPVLRWNMDNAYVRTDPAGNLKIDKAKSTEKVDGAVALVMALDRALKNANTGSSVYDERGLLVL